jgi:hypothetical protein
MDEQEYSTMTPQEAIKAIETAEYVLVQVRIATRHSDSAHLSENFPVAKEHAIAAMRKISDPQYVPDIEVSDDGTTVTIGRDGTAKLEENFSHFENNNGNF